MKQSVIARSDDVSIFDLRIGEEQYRLDVLNTAEHKKVMFALAHPNYMIWIHLSAEGVLTFMRAFKGGSPKEYLQRDLVSGEVSWNSAKPYRSSGREYVEVHLGLDVMAG